LTLRYEAAGSSDPGKRRPSNEDAFGFETDETGLQANFVVCDGVGGAAAGEVASKLAVEAMLSALRQNKLSEDAMQAAVSAANSRVHQRAGRDFKLAGMGTTLVSLAVRESHAWIANVGDSRCYRLRGSDLELLTQDHTLVNEQVRCGSMTQMEAAISPMRNVITRAVGTLPEVMADIFPLEVLTGDLFLLTSDGLTREISEEAIAGIMQSSSALQAACGSLIEAANRAGGNDNITCLLVRAI
jgi:PPM family protein phosphatase